MPYLVSGVQGWKGKLMTVTSASSDVRPRPSAEVQPRTKPFSALPSPDSRCVGNGVYATDAF